MMPLLNSRSWNGIRSGLVSMNLHDNKNNHDSCSTARKDLMELRNDVTESTCDNADASDDGTDKRPIVVVTEEMNDDTNDGGINNNKRNVDRLRLLILNNVNYKKCGQQQSTSVSSINGPVVVVAEEMNDDANDGGINNNKRNVDRLRHLVLNSVNYKKREQQQSSSVSSINGKTLIKEPLVKLKSIVTKGAKEIQYRTKKLQQQRQQHQQHQLYSPMKESEWFERSRYNSSDSCSVKSRRSSTRGIHGPTCKCDFCSTVLFDKNFHTNKNKYLQFTPMDHDRSIIESDDDNYVPYFNDCSERLTKHRSCFYDSSCINDTSGTIDEYYSKSLIESLTNDSLKIGFSVDGSDADDDDYNNWDEDEEKDDTSRSHTYSGMVTIYEECDEDDDDDDSQSNGNSSSSCTSFDDIDFAVYEQKQFPQQTTMPKQVKGCSVEDTFGKDNDEDDPSEPTATTTSSSSSGEDMDSWVLPLFPETSPYLNLNVFDEALPETLDSLSDHAITKRQRSLSSLSLLQFEESDDGDDSDDSDNSTSSETIEMRTSSNTAAKDDVILDQVEIDNIQRAELLLNQRHDCTTVMQNETIQQEAESSLLCCSAGSELNESKAPRDGATLHLQECLPKLESLTTTRNSIVSRTISTTRIDATFSDEKNYDHEEMMLSVTSEEKIQEISDEDKNSSVNEEKEIEAATTTIHNLTGFAGGGESSTVGCIHNHQDVVLDRLSVVEITSNYGNETTMSIVEEDVLSGDVVVVEPGFHAVHATSNNETTVVEADRLDMKDIANIKVEEDTVDIDVIESQVAPIATIDATATNEDTATIVETNECIPGLTDNHDTATTETAITKKAPVSPIESSASEASSTVSHDIATAIKDEIKLDVATFERITEVIVQNEGEEAGTTVHIDATATNENIVTIDAKKEYVLGFTDDDEAVHAETTVSTNAAALLVEASASEASSAVSHGCATTTKYEIITEHVAFEHNTELPEEHERKGETTVSATNTKEPPTDAVIRIVSVLDISETKDRSLQSLNNEEGDTTLKDATCSDGTSNLTTPVEGKKYDDKVETNDTVTVEESHDQEEAESVNTVIFATLSEVNGINGKTTGVRSVEENLLLIEVNINSDIAALSDQTETIVAKEFITGTTSQNGNEIILVESNISKQGELEGVNSSPRSILQISSSCISAGKRKKSLRWIDEEDEDDDEDFDVDDDYSINIDDNDSCCCIIHDGVYKNGKEKKEKTRKKKSLVTIHPFPSWWHRKMSSKLSREEKREKRKSKPVVERDRISL